MYKISKNDKSFSSFSFSLYYTFKSLLTEARLEPGWASTIELLLQKYLTVLCCKLFSQEKFHPRCLTGSKISFRLRVLNIELTFVPSLQIKPKKYSEKMCDIVFDRRKVVVEQSTERVFIQKQLSGPKCFLKKVLWEISQNSQENICTRIPLWCFLVKFAKFARTPLCRTAPDDCFWL